MQKIAAGYTVAEMNLFVSVKPKHRVSPPHQPSLGRMYGSQDGLITRTLLNFCLFK